MITEDYCSYEVAKHLKEKGFDESTNLVWYEHLPVSLDCQNLANKKARDYFYHNETTEHNSSYKNSRHKPKYIYGDIFSCPTHQMAMKWLREKGVYLNIRIALNRMEDDVINNIHWVVDILDFNSGEWKDNDIWTDTYEEAVEAALKYSLENLI